MLTFLLHHGDDAPARIYGAIRCVTGTLQTAHTDTPLVSSGTVSRRKTQFILNNDKDWCKPIHWPHLFFRQTHLSNTQSIAASRVPLAIYIPHAHFNMSSPITAASNNDTNHQDNLSQNSPIIIDSVEDYEYYKQKSFDYNPVREDDDGSHSTFVYFCNDILGSCSFFCFGICSESLCAAIECSSCVL